MPQRRHEREYPHPPRYRQAPANLGRTYDPNYYNRTNQGYEGEGSTNYLHLEQLVRHLQDEIEEMKALHYKEISEIKSLHETEIFQIKAALKGSHNDLKAASEVIYSELQASYSNITSQSNKEFALVHKMILELHAMCSREANNNNKGDNNNPSEMQFNGSGSKQQSPLTITDGTTRPGYSINQDLPPFGEIFGKPSIDKERNVISRLKNIESFVDPLRDEIVINHGKARFLNFGSAVADNEGDETEDLEADIYSLLYVAAPCSATFFFSIMIAVGQFCISALIIVDLLSEREKPFDVASDNPYRLPAKVDWQVACAQFSSLVIAFVTQSDVITSAKMILIGYDPDVEKANPGATYPKFLLSTILRFGSGVVTIFVSVLIIIQSSEVLEIFMNFAAVAFISELDNIAFETASNGLLGRKLKAATERVEDIKMKVQKQDYGWLINTLFIALFIPFLLGLLFVRFRQSNGYILAATSCNGLSVQFGDQEYAFSTDVKFDFVGEGVNKTFPGSTRTLPLLHTTPPPLLYQYFSGRYVAEREEWRESRLEEHQTRPVYWERGIKDPTSGKFYYCDNIKAWVFTIEALYNTPGVIPEEAITECAWGWLMQSPPTEAITLDEAPDKNWKVWTGEVVDLGDSTSFSIRCTDCERNTDCGLDNGVCRLGKCKCNEGWQGISCNVPEPYCPNLGRIHYGESSYEYFEDREFVIAKSDDGKPLEFYERPMYVRNFVRIETLQITLVEIIMYTGRRWFDTFWNLEDLNKVNDFHAYWDNVLDLTTKWYSDPTDSILPTGFEWNEIQPSRSRGSFGEFGFSLKVHARFECLHVDCVDRPTICGEKGDCVERIEILNTSENFQRHNCECIEDFGGFYCEHEPTGPYAAEMYAEYNANPTLFIEKNGNLTYLQYWETELRENWGGEL